MKRRKFVAAAAMGTAMASCASTAAIAGTTGELEGQREFYEWRTYEMAFRGNANLLKTYLKDSLKPALKKAGVNHFQVFSEQSNSTPTNLHVLISYPGIEAYTEGLAVQQSSEFKGMTMDYDQNTNAIFTRQSSFLLHAFEGLQQMLDPIEGVGVYELRIYEGYNEDAVRRKIKMFNEGELPLFRKIQLQPIFFGEMIIGPYMPCLVYMLNYKNMDHRAEAWKEFIAHPEWKEMSGKEEFANSVSNIQSVFLESS